MVTKKAPEAVIEEVATPITFKPYEAVVKTSMPNANLRVHEEPGLDATFVCSLSDGTHVTVIGEANGWCQIGACRFVLAEKVVKI